MYDIDASIFYRKMVAFMCDCSALANDRDGRKDAHVHAGVALDDPRTCRALPGGACTRHRWIEWQPTPAARSSGGMF